jgi:hypothetical protein
VEESPRGLEAPNHFFGRLFERGPHERVTAVTRGEDESLTDAPSFTVIDESETSKVHLQFDARRWVVDSNCRRGALRGAETLDTEPRQSALGHDDPVASEQDADLGNGEVLLDPGLDPGFFFH